MPQDPPHPSLPQVAVWQMSGVGKQPSMQVPLTHARGPFPGGLSGQLPQEPPQPSSPQILSVQLATHAPQVPSFLQISPILQPMTVLPASPQSGSVTPQPQSQAPPLP